MQFAHYTNERKIENSTATFRILIIFVTFQEVGLADSLDTLFLPL